MFCRGLGQSDATTIYPRCLAGVLDSQARRERFELCQFTKEMLQSLRLELTQKGAGCPGKPTFSKPCSKTQSKRCCTLEYSRQNSGRGTVDLTLSRRNRLRPEIYDPPNKLRSGIVVSISKCFRDCGCRPFRNYRVLRLSVGT